MVLVNNDKRAMEYYGFDDQALNSQWHIPQQTKSAYPVRAVRQSKVLERQNRPHTVQWTVEDLVRCMYGS
jgi:TfoX/Sxy family transcriptional regulator of competence genes